MRIYINLSEIVLSLYIPDFMNFIQVQMESDMWRQKYEVEGVAKAEELEMAKLKLQVKTGLGTVITLKNIRDKL